MTLPFVPLLVAVLGLLLYAFAPNAKASEAGRLLFFAGALAALLAGGHSITIR